MWKTNSAVLVKPNMHMKDVILTHWWYAVLLWHDSVYAKFREKIDLSLNVTTVTPSSA